MVVEEGEDPATGKRSRSWHSGYRTRRQANDGLQTILSELERGTYVAPSRGTVADFITEEWLPAVARELRPGTVAMYGTMLRAYALPRIGSKLLQALRPGHLNALYEELQASGGRGGKALSPKTMRNLHTTLHRAFRDAVGWGRISRNPADHCNPPRFDSPEMKTWSAEELGRFLVHVQGDRLSAAWITLATTGLRRGELLSLRWAEVDLPAGRLSIRRTLVLVGTRPAFSVPKTDKGKRTVPIPPETVAALKAHRASQLEERVALGPGYEGGDLVFAREDGKPLHPGSFSEAFDRRVKAAGLPKIRLHDLRHGWATMALQAGIPAKVVSEILGHASISIALDTYSHAIPAMQEEAAAKVAALIFPR